ncbi:MAG: hypothetical protein Q7R85_00900 [bacterium]|nr:hypothetical protein [bacterium]
MSALMTKVDRTKVTPQFIVNRGISFNSLFGKTEPELVAVEILRKCVKERRWVTFRVPQRKDWWGALAAAGLLERRGSIYRVTDLFIQELLNHSGKSTKENFTRNAVRGENAEVRRKIGEYMRVNNLW